jgi:hypothetical protein
MCRIFRDMFWIDTWDRTKKATLTYELVVMPVMYYRFPPYIRGGLQIEIEGQSFLITYLTGVYP